MSCSKPQSMDDPCCSQQREVWYCMLGIGPLRPNRSLLDQWLRRWVSPVDMLETKGAREADQFQPRIVTVQPIFFLHVSRRISTGLDHVAIVREAQCIALISLEHCRSSYVLNVAKVVGQKTPLVKQLNRTADGCTDVCFRAASRPSPGGAKRRFAPNQRLERSSASGHVPTFATPLPHVCTAPMNRRSGPSVGYQPVCVPTMDRGRTRTLCHEMVYRGGCA